MNLNKVFILGNLTSDPELRNLPSGQPVCNFRMATNQIWTDKETGQKQQKTEYHTVVAWRKLATVASQYLKKGGLVFVEGRLTTRSWNDASGNKRYRTEIVAENIQLVPITAVRSDVAKESDQITMPGAVEGSEEKPTEDIPTIDEDSGMNDISPDEIPF